MKCNIHMSFKIKHESSIKFPAFRSLFHLAYSRQPGAEYLLSSVLGDIVNRKLEIRGALTT